MTRIGQPHIAAWLLCGMLLSSPALARPPLGHPIAAQAERPAAAPADAYRLDLSVDLAHGTLEGRMALRYRNVSAAPLSSVRLRLDMNLNPGVSIDVVQVADEDGRTLERTLQPLAFGKLRSDAGALDVALRKPLAPGAETTLRILFRSAGKHISTDMLVLQDDPYHSLDAWYPKAMTPRDGGWSIDDDRLADYEVTLRYPAGYTVASTGRRLGEPATAGDGMELRLQAARVRGFTIFASKGWSRQVRETGPITLAVYLPSDAASYADRLLDAAADTIGFYQREYGPYPATHLDIVGIGSMSERSQGGSTDCSLIVVFLGTSLEQQYRFLVAHEIAHQYFSVNIGFPRDSTAWVPVGLGLMMDEHYLSAGGLDASWGRRMSENYLRAERMHFDTTLTQPVQALLASPAPWSFAWNMALTHGKAYAVCAMLRDLVGRQAFQNVVRTLIRERAGGLVREADLVAALEAESRQKLDWFVTDWIEGKATFDYAIRSVHRSDDGWTVDVARVGTGSFPAKVQLTTAEGETLVQRVDRTRATTTLKFRTRGEAKSVRLDPEGACPDINPADNVWPPADQSGPGKPPRAR